jgi:hypothetical protein
MFLAGVVPVYAIFIFSAIQLIFKGRKLFLLLVIPIGIVLLACAFLGFGRLLIGKDYLYDQYCSLQRSKFADGKTINVKADGAKLFTDIPANPAKAIALNNGTSLMLVGESDTGQLLVRYRDKEKKLTWGWVDAKQTNYQNNSDNTALVPAAIISKTLNLRLYPNPSSIKNNATKNRGEIQVAVIGRSSNPFLKTKVKNGYVPVYAWSSEYRYAGYAPIDCLFLYTEPGAKPPTSLTRPEGAALTVPKSNWMYNRPHWEPGNFRDYQDGTAFLMNDFTSKELKPNDVVIVTGEANEDGWLPIWYDGEYGWYNERNIRQSSAGQ